MRSICVDCGGHVKATHPCLTGKGNKGGVMIIGDMPTFMEDDDAELFTGSVSKWLYRELLGVGIDMEQCYLTKAIKCFMPTKPTRKIIKACREILIEEVRDVKPQYILTLGAISLDVVLGKANLTKYHGKMFEWEGAKVIPTFHPAIVIKQPRNMWEFRSDITYFSRMCEGEWKPPDDFRWCIVNSEKELNEMIEDVRASNVISYDIETTGLIDKIKTGKLIMIGIATDNKCYCLPLETKYNKLGFTDLWAGLNDLLSKNGIKKVAQNAKFDNRWLRSRGVDPYVDFDTYLAAYLLNVTIPHGLKYMAKTYLGAADYDDGIEFKEDLTEEEFMKMAKYCCLDVYYTLKLYYILKQELLKE